MLIPRYAGIGETCPLFDLEVLSGGQLSSTNKYFSFQLQNRCGFNLPSVSSALAITVNSKVRITIPESTRKPAWDIHYFIVSCGNTADASTHVQIARVPGYQFGAGISPQSVPQDLPYILELTSNEHIALAPSVAAVGNLPAGSDRLDGQVRYVNSLGFWLEYSADSTLQVSAEVIQVDAGQWIRIGSASTYVSSTESGMGCDRAITTINPVTTIPTPPYPALNRVLPEWEAKYWIYNDDLYPVSAGTEFGIELEFNNKRSPDLLSGLFMVRFLGFVRPDGSYRTEDSEGRDFPSLGGYFAWSPKTETPFATIDDLLPGEALALGVKPFFSVAELNNQVPPKSVIGIIPVMRTQSGDYNPLGKLLPGGTVYNTGEKYRVVPGVGLSAFILPGSAIVASYDFPVKPKRGIYGVSPNTAGQKVIINGNGAVFLELPTYTPIASEAIRAIIGTVAGVSSAGAWSTSVAIASGQGLKIDHYYPCDANGNGTIRSDYPDVIKGNNKGNFNPARVRIYVQRTDTNEIRMFSGFSVIASSTQEFFLSSWDDGIAGSLPVASVEFSLFASGASALASSISGAFPAANYRVCYAFEYDGNQITSISHASPPAIGEWDGDFQPAETIIDSVITLPSGSLATVENIGTSNVARLKFGIPEGEKGDKGEKGDAGTGGTGGGGGTGFRFRGNWVSTPNPPYVDDDLVHYEGSTWRAFLGEEDSDGIITSYPGDPNSGDWQLFVERGRVGMSGFAGDSFKWRGLWTENNFYSPGDIVTNENGSILVVKQPVNPDFLYDLVDDIVVENGQTEPYAALVLRLSTLLDGNIPIFRLRNMPSYYGGSWLKVQQRNGLVAQGGTLLKTTTVRLGEYFPIDIAEGRFISVETSENYQIYLGLEGATIKLFRINVPGTEFVPF